MSNGSKPDGKQYSDREIKELAGGIVTRALEYLRLLRAYLVARRFYGRYEHLARDVALHPQMDVRLDVYSPDAGKGYPVLILIHGGGWRRFKKGWFATAAMRLLPQRMVAG